MKNQSLKDLIDIYTKAEKEIYNRFNFPEFWHIYPMEDHTDENWFFDNYEEGVVWSTEEFTTKSIKEGSSLYGGDVFCPRDTDTGIWKAEGYTLVLVDTQNDSNVVMMLFSDEKQYKNQKLIDLLKECW